MLTSEYTLMQFILACVVVFTLFSGMVFVFGKLVDWVFDAWRGDDGE